MEKIFDIAKDSEQKWGVIAQGIDRNFEEIEQNTSIPITISEGYGSLEKPFQIGTYKFKIIFGDDCDGLAVWSKTGSSFGENYTDSIQHKKGEIIEFTLDFTEERDLVIMYDGAWHKLATSIIQQLDKQSLNDWSRHVNEDIDKINQDINVLKLSSPIETEEVLYDEIAPDEGYVYVKNGQINEQSGYSYIDFCEIKNAIEIEAIGEANEYLAGLAVYDGAYNYLESYNQFVDRKLILTEVRQDAVYARISSATSKGLPSIKVTRSKLSTFFNSILDEKLNSIEAISRFDHIAATSLSEGETLILNSIPDIKNYYGIGVILAIDIMGKIRIQKGDDLYRGGIIEIDAANVYEYRATSQAEPSKTTAHGLNLSSCSLSVLIQFNTTVDRRVILRDSYGNTATIELMGWNGCQDRNVILTAVNGNYTNISLHFDGTWFEKQTWLFGDSYTDYWQNRLYSKGFINFALDGRSGRKSQDAFISLIEDLTYGTPKKIVWLMGMNDPDSSVAVNSNWLNAYSALKILCDKKGIQLILSTIPNTPTMEHSFKNEIVRNSGLPYVDVATSVGANSSGSLWYEGLMSEDNVHPTDFGSEVIANAIASAVPSIALG